MSFFFEDFEHEALRCARILPQSRSAPRTPTHTGNDHAHTGSKDAHTGIKDAHTGIEYAHTGTGVRG